jgi:hypothetical protein
MANSSVAKVGGDPLQAHLEGVLDQQAVYQLCFHLPDKKKGL